MNKTQLAEALAAKHGLTKVQAADIIGTFVDTIRDTVASGEDVVIPGHGSYKRVLKPARTARNPATQETVEVPARWVPKFSPGGAFEAAVRVGGQHALAGV